MQAVNELKTGGQEQTLVKDAEAASKVEDEEQRVLDELTPDIDGENHAVQMKTRNHVSV